MCDITCLTWYCNENRIQEHVRVIYNETFFFLSRGGALINASSFHLSFSILRNLCSCGFRRPFFFLAASMSYTTMYVVLSWWGNAWLPSARLLHMNISVVYQLDAEQEEAWKTVIIIIIIMWLMVIFLSCLVPEQSLLLLLVNALKCSFAGLRVREQRWMTIKPHNYTYSSSCLFYSQRRFTWLLTAYIAWSGQQWWWRVFDNYLWWHSVEMRASKSLSWKQTFWGLNAVAAFRW